MAVAYNEQSTQEVWNINTYIVLLMCFLCCNKLFVTINIYILYLISDSVINSLFLCVMCV